MTARLQPASHLLRGANPECGTRASVTALVLPDNQPMLAVFRRLGADLAYHATAGAIGVSLDLATVPPVA